MMVGVGRPCAAKAAGSEVLVANGGKPTGRSWIWGPPLARLFAYMSGIYEPLGGDALVELNVLREYMPACGERI